MATAKRTRRLANAFQFCPKILYDLLIGLKFLSKKSILYLTEKKVAEILYLGLEYSYKLVMPFTFHDVCVCVEITYSIVPLPTATKLGIIY